MVEDKELIIKKSKIKKGWKLKRKCERKEKGEKGKDEKIFIKLIVNRELQLKSLQLEVEQKGRKEKGGEKTKKKTKRKKEKGGERTKNKKEEREGREKERRENKEKENR